MTAPERRRPLPALAFIGALCLLTALVWFRVLHRSDASTEASKSPCPTPSKTVVEAPTVLPVPSRVSVLVLNSTQRNGLATATKKVLLKRGFNVTQAADDSTSYGGHGLVKGVAEIRYGPTAIGAATLLRYVFPTATMKQVNSSSATVMVSLGAKYKTIASATAVTKALDRAHLKLSKAPIPVVVPSPTQTNCSG